MTQTSLYRQYYKSGTFHIFPAMIPLIEIIPWLLTLIGTLAGGLSFMSGYAAFHARYRKLIYVFMVLCFIAAGGIYAWERHRVPDEDVGSRLAEVKEFPLIMDVDKVDTSKPNLGWMATSVAEFLGTPVIDGDMMYIGTFSGTLEVRSLHDGRLIWQLNKHQPIFTTPTLTPDRLYIGEGLHTADLSGLTALDRVNGKILWERKFANHIESYPAVDEANKRLWIGAGGLGLWALDTESGDKIWWAKIGHIDIAPLYSGGRLFVVAKLTEENDGSKFFEIDPDTGAVIQSWPLNGNPMGKIMEIGSGKFVVSTAIGQVGLNKKTDKGWVYGIDLNHSKPVRWMIETATMGLPEGQLSTDKATAFFALKNGEVIAVDTATGTVRWNKKCGNEFKADVALMPGKVAALTTDGIVHFLDAATGKEVKTLNVGKGSYAAPVYKDGTLYVTTQHNIHAFIIGQ